MVDEVDILWESVKDAEDKDQQIAKCIKEIHNFEHINKRWENSAKMRSWINEKKSNLMERIKKEVETEFSKKKEEEKQKEKDKEAKL